MLVKTLLVILVSGGLLLPGASNKPEQPDEALFRTLRAGDLAGIRAALAHGADLNARNPYGDTPLMYAALYSDAATMKLLLDRGANPNAANEAGGTALLWATNSLDKVRLLVERGADVNAASKLGKTPLLAVAGRDGAGPVVSYLVEHGAKLDAKDNLSGIPVIPLGGGGATALIQASQARDGEALALLLNKGADVNVKEKNGSTALLNAIALQNRKNIQALLAHNADVNAALAAGVSPLLLAAMRNDAETAAALLARGAKLEAEDAWGNTALLWAAYTDLGTPGVVKLLLDAGASLEHKNKLNETALTIALRRGDTPVVRLLRAKGAVQPEDRSTTTAAPAAAAAVKPVSAPAANDPIAAVAKSLPLLQKGGPEVFKHGCVSCHNNLLPAMAVAMARNRGQQIDEKALERDRKQLISLLKPAREMLLENGDNIPDMQVTAGYALMSLAAQGYAADAITDAVVHNLASKQNSDGSWTLWAPRPPLEFGDIQATALSLRALQLYVLEGRRTEFDNRIRKAVRWLAQAEPATTEEENWRLMGLTWGKADRKVIAQAVQRVRNLQRADGGWGQLPGLGTDAYATGQSLYALRQAGTDDKGTLDRGTAYLLRTQQADGTWQVKSRSFPFQPYFESGFPYGPDQWISMAGTSWAALALLQAGQPDLRVSTVTAMTRMGHGRF